MKVNITSKGFTANDNQVLLIEKKFEKLSKYFTDDTAVNVTMGYKKKRQTMEAMITVKGILFRAEHTDQDMNVCLDKVVERLSSQITRYKKKLQKNHRQIKEINFDLLPEDDVDETPLTPIKKKSFELVPMDVEEAVLQMELLEHTFFVFMNSETSRVAVVYKRNDGDYGLLEPSY